MVTAMAVAFLSGDDEAAYLPGIRQGWEGVSPRPPSKRGSRIQVPHLPLSSAFVSKLTEGHRLTTIGTVCSLRPLSEGHRITRQVSGRERDGVGRLVVHSTHVLEQLLRLRVDMPDAER